MSEAAWQGAFDAEAGMRHYDAVLVPRMLEPWAELLLTEFEMRAGDAVLDVACGPGTVIRLAAQHVGATGRVVGCDISAAMLTIAQEKPVADGAAPIEYVECSADALTLPDAAFDVVTCQQGLQFFPDRAAAMNEMRRVARADARIAVACWSAIDDSPPLRVSYAGWCRSRLRAASTSSVTP